MEDLDDLDAIALAQFLEPRQPRVPMPLDEGETLIDDELITISKERLERIAASHPPPQEWFDSPEEDLFAHSNELPLRTDEGGEAWRDYR